MISILKKPQLTDLDSLYATVIAQLPTEERLAYCIRLRESLLFDIDANKQSKRSQKHMLSAINKEIRKLSADN